MSRLGVTLYYITQAGTFALRIRHKSRVSAAMCTSVDIGLPQRQDFIFPRVSQHHAILILQLGEPYPQAGMTSTLTHTDRQQTTKPVLLYLLEVLTVERQKVLLFSLVPDHIQFIQAGMNAFVVVCC